MDQEIYNAWVNKLPTLTVIQLNDVSTRIKLLDKTATKEHSGKQSFGDRLLQVLCDTLKKHNVETPSVPSLRKSSAYVNSNAKIQDLEEYFQTVSKSKIVQNSILKMALDLLYVDLVSWQGVAVSSYLILRQIHRIPAVINRSFPGYSSAGLLVKIVKGG